MKLTQHYSLIVTYSLHNVNNNNNNNKPFNLNVEDLKSLQDLYIGLKLMLFNKIVLNKEALYEVALDKEDKIKSNIPYRGEKEINGLMIDIIVKLDNYDECNIEWL